MRCAVMGAGAVGGFFGSRLSVAGHEVHFITRGAHMKAIQRNGLLVRSTQGEWRAMSAATDNPAAVGPVDLILFSVKAYDLRSAARMMAPMVGSHTAIIPLLNGIDAAEHLQSLYGSAVLGGSSHIEAFIVEPGVVAHTSAFSYLTFGELGPASERAERLRDVFAEAQINVRLVEDIRCALWQKLIYLTTLSGLTTVTQQPIGAVRELPEGWALIERLVREVIAVGLADGVNLPPDQAEITLERFRTLHSGMRSSMARDRERGRRLEADAIQGAVVRRAHRLGVPVPSLDMLYALLLPLVDGGGSSGSMPESMVAASWSSPRG